MNLNPPANPSVFPDRAQVTSALVHAVERARIIAEQTGTKLIVLAPSPKSTSDPVKPQ